MLLPQNHNTVLIMERCQLFLQKDEMDKITGGEKSVSSLPNHRELHF